MLIISLEQTFSLDNRNEKIKEMQKKIILICVLCISLVNAYTQKIGIKAGLSMTSAKYIYLERKGLVSNKIGIQVGLISEIPISNTIYINSGILFSQKGTMYNFFDPEEFNLSINYLELPLNISYKYYLGSKKIFAQVGPYLGYVLSNKFLYSGNEESYGYGSSANEMNRLDIGLNFGTGLEISKVQFGINYGLGLTNITNHRFETLKNRTLSFSVGILFGKP